MEISSSTVANGQDPSLFLRLLLTCSWISNSAEADTFLVRDMACSSHST